MTDVAGRAPVVRMLKPFVPAPIRRWLWRIRSLAWLPLTEWSDYLWALSRFRAVHKRFPRPDSWLFNDVHFRLRSELTAPERVFISDKALVKDFIAGRVGAGYAVPTLAILRSAEEVRQFAFPPDCVIKPTHLSGAAQLRWGVEPVDVGRIRTWFARSLYRELRERNYKTLQPKVIVEPLVFGMVPPDYKIFCVDGDPRLIQVDIGRYAEHRRSYFDRDWRQQPFKVLYPLHHDMPRPANLDEMLNVASRLSQGFSLLRVDLYSDGRQLLVGELTNCTGGGLSQIFSPSEGEIIASRLLWPDRWPNA